MKCIQSIPANKVINYFAIFNFWTDDCPIQLYNFP